MKPNIHKIDKVGRVLLAVVVAILYLTGTITGTAAIILGIIAVVLLATVFINFCPVYGILGISTKKKTTQSTKD